MQRSSLTPTNGVNFELSTWHKGLQIYKPGKTTLAAPEKDARLRSDQFRDCIDVAVKLAMNFNVSTIHHDLSDLKGSIFGCSVVQNISNIKAVDECVLTEELPVRVKQISDGNIRQIVSV